MRRHTDIAYHNVYILRVAGELHSLHFIFLTISRRLAVIRMSFHFPVAFLLQGIRLKTILKTQQNVSNSERAELN